VGKTAGRTEREMNRVEGLGRLIESIEDLLMFFENI